MFSKILAASFLVVAVAGYAADGDLDAAFGTAGKVQLGPNTGFSGPVANDVAIQPDGKIVVVGYETGTSGGFESWRIARLNADGSVDTSFGSNGMLDWNGGSAGTRAHAVAVRPDGRIVVGGNFQNEIEVSQFTPNGSPDPNFAGGQGYILLTPPAGDSNYLSRLVIDTDGSIDVAGTYYANQNSFNSNEFFFDRIAADGSSHQPFQFQFGGGPNQDAHATDLAIDSQGRYVVVGYAQGTHGYDCAVIRITRDLYDVDRAFHYQDPDNYGYTIMPFDFGGDDNDVCNAVAIFPGGYIAIGGHATANASNGAYQAAALAELDDNGNPYRYYSDQIGYPAKFAFSYSLNPTSGQTNDIVKLIVDRYDSKYAQLLAVGTGNQYAQPPGTYFGIARVTPAQSYVNFSLDTTLNGKGVMGVYFAQRPTGLGNFVTTNTGLSGVYTGGKLTAAGYTEAANGQTLAVTRLAPFDGLFRNGFETPSY
ncbi:MAG: delta-60 repeat domain-containing protein [Rudaea sp.]